MQPTTPAQLFHCLGTGASYLEKATGCDDAEKLVAPIPNVSLLCDLAEGEFSKSDSRSVRRASGRCAESSAV